MCSVCLSTPCFSRCPGADEPTPVYKCSECGEGIFEDEKYLDGLDKKVCLECLNGMTVSEILEVVGESLSRA